MVRGYCIIIVIDKATGVVHLMPCREIVDAFMAANCFGPMLANCMAFLILFIMITGHNFVIYFGKP